MSKFHELNKKRMLFLDGAFGTELQKNGLKQGDIPELWNITHGDIIKKIHEDYINAGADIINTNTFGGNKLKLKELGIYDKIKEINETAVKIAKSAARKNTLIAGSIGPTGVFLEPFGPLSFQKMYDVYKEQIEILANAGVDIINFETMVDIGELKAAVLAAKDVCKLPIFANVTFDQNGRTLTGSDAVTAFNILDGLGCDCVGTNCGLGPKGMYEILKNIRKDISAKLVIQANAGLPIVKDGKTVFTLKKEEYVKHIKNIVELGVSVLGGCCGTSPEFIKSLVKEFSNTKLKKIEENNTVKLSSPNKTVICSDKTPFLKIGEKINPSASKKLRTEIKNGNLALAKELAKRQEEAGAHVLDVNMGTSGIDEKSMICKAVKEITAIVKSPICIDSTRNEAIEEAVKIYPGRPLINSITGEKEKIKAILPIMKRYGAYAILLPLNEDGIPETVEKRKKIIKTILDEAKKLDIPKERFIVDCLVMTVSAAQPLVMTAIKTTQMVKNEFGLCTTGGLSNVSFGLPSREIVNANYLAMLISAGLNSAIINVENDLINSTIDSCNVITGRDTGAKIFINKYKNSGKVTLNKTNTKTDEISETVKDEKNNLIRDALYQSILVGDSDNVIPFIDKYLKDEFSAIDIINSYMIPAIVEVGDKYDKNEYFLPQLMMSAETMKKGFTHLSPLLQKESSTSRGKIILATVKGDVHDIGKNIVSIMLSNHGFEVVDLGKDVESEKILDTAVKENAVIIGLSALMTTTMEEMNRFMELKNKKNINIPVMVGGAVVNDDYAKSIGAVYAKDAVRAVEKAKQILAND